MTAATADRTVAPLRPRLLDLYCGAGGCARGYQQAGFHVTGLDIKPQPRYAGDVFILGDALSYVAEHGHEYDAIHASPPCQRHSRLAHAPNRDMSAYPDLIEPTRVALREIGTPWVIENVVGAPLATVIELCGLMFGLRVYRHRRFESNVLLLAPPHPRHRELVKERGSGSRLGYYTSEVGHMVTVAGHLFSMAAGSAAMGIDWMRKDELAEAIPPAYARFIGAQLMQALAVAGSVGAALTNGME